MIALAIVCLNPKHKIVIRTLNRLRWRSAPCFSHACQHNPPSPMVLPLSCRPRPSPCRSTSRRKPIRWCTARQRRGTLRVSR